MKSDHPDDGINRRHFLLLTAAAAAGCEAVNGGAPAGTVRERTVDAGPVAAYAADGVYDAFRDQGFFIVRKAGSLFALSAICTHRRCKLKAEPDRTFYCHCHGSTFDPAGKVTEGPAKRDLPVLASLNDEAKHFVVKVPI